MSSEQVLECGTAAQAQGASHLGKLGVSSDPRNAHRSIVRALGHPPNAPDITWIDIPDAQGFRKPFPVLCPINTFEKTVLEDERPPQLYYLGALFSLRLERRKFEYDPN
jgi:hypothetical protein